jgi:ParB family chromosome partitioning protein
MATAKKKKRAPARRKTPKKAAPRTRGVLPLDCRLENLSGDAAQTAARIESEGGLVIASYCEPLGKQPLLLAALPIDRVEPTPFQRDLSDAHHKKLSAVIDRTGLFLDPVIAITAPTTGFWTPNGLHRLAAMRRLGAKSIIALVVPKREIAWQILALNTEKAHNLREKSLEVIRIFRHLLEEDPRRLESDLAFYLEEPALITLGLCYEKRGNFAGGSYHSILRRLQAFLDEPLNKALPRHARAADQVFELDERVCRRQNQPVALDQR